MGKADSNRGLPYGAAVAICLLAGWITGGFVASIAGYPELAILFFALPSMICCGLCAAMPRVVVATCYSLSAFLAVLIFTSMWAGPIALLSCLAGPFLFGCLGVLLGRRLRHPRLPVGDPECPACGHVLYYAENHRCPDCGRCFQFREVSLQNAEIRDEVLYRKPSVAQPRDSSR
jgi:hypothetical protein